ncbi:MAG: hypothetical protein E6H69_03905 [Betaproteobacteria bacterium]|nr:MAG: hypothetical protein E6H69_03905 [Betaproteobacteria bacterium]
MNVASEHHQPRLVENDRLRGHAGIQRQLEALRWRKRIHLMAHVVVIRKGHRRPDRYDGDSREELLVDLVDRSGPRTLSRAQVAVHRDRDQDRIDDGTALLIGDGGGDLGALCMRRTGSEGQCQDARQQ